MSTPGRPIHPSMENRMNADYKAYYNANTLNLPKLSDLPIAAIRAAPRGPYPGSGPLAPVGKTEDIEIVPESGPSKGVKIPARCYTPEGEAPQGGWPVLVYYHGGGWVVGSLESETDVITNVCSRSKCVIVSVDYRLAPEDPFPAAVDDSWAALLWVAEHGKEKLNINPGNLGVGGASAGGNLAAVMAQRAVTHGGPLIRTQALTIPITDNTLSVDTGSSWKENQHTPLLDPEMVMWFRNSYLPKKEDWANPDASPLLWKGDWSKLPPAIIVVAGLDILRDEGLAFGEKLRDAGVNVQSTNFEDQTHIFAAMSGVLEDARRGITVMCEGLHDAFYNKESILARANI